VLQALTLLLLTLLKSFDNSG